MSRFLALCALFMCLSTTVAYAATGASSALTVRVTPSREECFFDNVQAASVKVFLHFAVVSGGELDIDVNVYGPDNQIVWETEKSREARVLFKSKMPGLHKFCFSNKMSTVTSKTVSFHVQMGDTLQAATTRDPMERSIMNIYQGLLEVKNEQDYLRARERDHRDTAESTHNHVLVWSLIEIGLIVSMGLGHVTYLRKQFGKRRAV
eukprot:GILI01048640.1.p1 GENE.GILI01048640.1~~GILI01048640.1.p1  ORF type:complete len:206 (+),score=26.95 GILI01048640.1:60-677(+)